MTSLPSYADYGTYDESAHPDLWEGVVGYWAPCLGPTGLRLHDVSRGINWGTLTNMDAATDWVIDGGQYALDFDGTNDRIQASTVPITGQVTISAWCNFRSLADEMICNKQPTNTAFNLFVFGNNLTLRGGSTSPSIVFSVTGRTLEWMFIAGTINGTSGNLYINGASVSSGSVAAIGSTTGLVEWGAFSDFGGGYFVDGRMDQMCLQNRALSPNEVARMYQLGRGGMLERRRRRRVYTEQAGFRAHYRSQRAQLIGGGLR